MSRSAASREPFRWSVRVTNGGREKATVYARSNKIEIGLPVSFDVEYPEMTALEHALGALGADLVCGMQHLANKKRIEVDNVEVLVIGELDDPLAQLGVVGAKGHPGLKKISVQAYVGSLEDEAVVREVWGEMLQRSPLAATFKRAVELQLRVDFVL